MQRKDFLIFTLIFLALGILLIRQFYVSKEAQRLREGEEDQLLALEISRLIKANTDLRLGIKELSSTSEKYQKSLLDRKSAALALAESLEKYKIIAGVTQIEGPGVEIKISGDLGKEQMVDLINALRNIGIEGLSINGKRVVISSAFSETGEGLFMNGKKLEKPYLIWIIGNAPLIKEALERKGGVVEQIETGSKDTEVQIEEKEEMVLPAA